MRFNLDITDEKQLEQVEILRGDKPTEEFIASCFEQGLKLAEIQRQQMEAARKVAKHPLLQFPETKSEFKALDGAAIETALKENYPENPIVGEVTRLFSAYMGQVNEYARQHGNRLPAFLPVNVPNVPVEKAAFQLAANAIKAGLQKNAKAAAA